MVVSSLLRLVVGSALAAAPAASPCLPEERIEVDGRTQVGEGLVVAPDGQRLAVAVGEELRIVDLAGDRVATFPVPGIAWSPCWSPGGRFLAHLVEWDTHELELRVARVEDGAVRVITRDLGEMDRPISELAPGLAWSAAGDEVLLGAGSRGILAIDLGSGRQRRARDVATEWREVALHHPAPSGQDTLLFVAELADASFELVLETAGERRTLHASPSRLANPVSDGSTVYFTEEGREPRVLSVPLSGGEPAIVEADARRPSLSREGTLVLTRPFREGRQQLARFDREGRFLGAVGPVVEALTQPAASRDESRVAVVAKVAGLWDLWVFERSGEARRLTETPARELDPSWGPDDHFVLASVEDGETTRLAAFHASDERRSAPGATFSEPIGLGIEGRGPQLSGDRSTLMFERAGESGSGAELWTIEQSEGASPIRRRAGAGGVVEDGPAVLAYHQPDAHGRSQVWLELSADPSTRWLASLRGGRHPRIDPNQRELYYAEADRLVGVVRLNWKGMQCSKPYPRWSGAALGVSFTGDERNWDVIAGGAELLVARTVEEEIRTVGLRRAGVGRVREPVEERFVFAPVAEESARDRDWRADVAYLGHELPRLHRRAFHTTTRERFFAAIDGLIEDVPTLGDDHVLAGIARIVASIGDGHTSFGLGAQPEFRTLPILLYRMGEELWIVAADEEHEHLVAQQVLAFGETEMDEAWRRAREVVSRDNEMGVLQAAPRILTLAEALVALEIVEDPESVPLTLADELGGESTVELQPLPRGRAPQWVFAPEFYGQPMPRFLTRRDQSWWMESLDDERVLYVCYNAVRDDALKTFAQFSREVGTFLDRHDVDKLVIDLRNNSGGNGMLNQALIDEVVARPDIDREGHLFVILGRRTFSAAGMCALDFDAQTHALFVGEGTGARPNSYSETGRIRLPNSGRGMSCSLFYWQLAGPDDTRDWQEPDLPAPPTFDDFVEGIDPCMEVILSYGR